MKWFRCSVCKGILLDPVNYLAGPEEMKRYLEHNNDVHDQRYRKFVMPVVDSVKRHFDTSHKGLDFGCGTGPVISEILSESGYSIKLFDPFFHNNPELLRLKYDYIVCCEVIEHFNKPGSEFKLLRSLMDNNGRLICMTLLYSDDIDFDKWFYKTDPTHVFFYTEDTLKWIKLNFNFSSLEIRERLIEFTV